MLIFEIIIGCAVILYGALSIITGKNIFWKNGTEKYTEDSLLVYHRLSGILRVVLGIALLMIFIGGSSETYFLLKWTGISILWLAIAANVTLYLIALVKK